MTAPRTAVRRVEIRKSAVADCWIVGLREPTVARSADAALAVVKTSDVARAARGVIAVTIIDWTNTPDGFTPPKDGAQ